ncbi:hypothetical protein DXG01_008264 [Tephrocybe rancida]|nr:hypothetical protein DXG01_008264 [Tephrocybe rancida]
MSLPSLLRTVTAILFSSKPSTGNPNLPLEIIEEIVDNLSGKPSCLLNLALVCRFTLQQSRAVMFETLVFSNPTHARKLDGFLDLLEGPPTTFAAHIQNLYINGVFTKPYQYKPRKSIQLLAMKLPRLNSLRLASFDWPFLPWQLLDFFCSLPVEDVSIESIVFYKTKELIELFNQPLIVRGSQLTLYNLQIEDEVDSLLNYDSVLERDFHIRAIDSRTLVTLQPVRGPLKNDTKSLTIHSFHLRLYGSGYRAGPADLSLLQRHLLQIGPRLGTLVVDLCDAINNQDLELLVLYTRVDLSSCTALKAVHLGIIGLGSEQAVMMETTWKILESLPPSTIETVGLIFDAQTPAQDLAASLRMFHWAATTQRIRGIFPSLKQIKFKIGGYDLSETYLATQVDALAQDILEHVSTRVVFEACPWTSLYISLNRLNWRDFSA